MVSTPQTGSTQTTGVHAVFQIFGPVGTVREPSVSTAKHHLFHLQTPPLGLTIDSTRREKSVHASFITVYDVPRVAPSIAAIVQRRHSRRHLLYDNLKGVEYHRYLNPPPPPPPIPPSMSPLLVRHRTPSNSISVAVTGSPKLAPLLTLLLGRPSPERCCFIWTKRGLTACER